MYTRCVYAKHMGTCTRRHRWRPQRGCVEDTENVRSTPRGVAETHQNRIHQMSRPMRGAPFSFPYLGTSWMSHPLTTFGAASVADAFTTGDLGKEKDSTRHLSSLAPRQGRLSPGEKREKKVTGKMMSIKVIYLFLKELMTNNNSVKIQWNLSFRNSFA